VAIAVAMAIQSPISHILSLAWRRPSGSARRDATCQANGSVEADVGVWWSEEGRPSHCKSSGNPRGRLDGARFGVNEVKSRSVFSCGGDGGSDGE